MLPNELLVLLPAADDSVASSRIRVFTFAKELEAAGHPFTFDQIENPKAIIIQKRVTKEIINYAKRNKRSGSIVVYDVDDLGHALEHWVPTNLFQEILKIADIVITASEEQCEIIKSKYKINNIKAISNCIDYYPTSPVRTKPQNGQTMRILWFGNAQNLILFDKYIGNILQLHDIEIVICTDLKSAKDFILKWPQVKFVPWSLSKFLDTLQSCQMTCLMHDGAKADRAKANNRMITSINWGVPALVSNTPAYVQTAKEAGIEDAVFKDGNELLSKIEHFRNPLLRELYLNAAQKLIWDRYSPKSIMKEYLAAIDATSEKLKQLNTLQKLLRKII